AWNGEIFIDSISGGTAKYSILWNTPFADTTMDVDSLPAGIYTIIVWDKNGCFSTDSIELIEPDPVEAEIDTISARDYNGAMISCIGFSDAILGVTKPDGGTPPYTYNWYYLEIPGDTVQFSNDSIVSGRNIGYHKVEMTDAAGCLQISEIIVTQPDSLSSQSFVSDALCYNDPSGSIDFQMDGGTAPYTILWIESGFAEFGVLRSSQENLVAGDYSLSVLDTNLCPYYDTLTVLDPDSLEVNPNVIDLTCPDAYDGIIEISPSGGTSDYSVIWADGSSDLIRERLGPDLYIVEVMDNHRCITIDTIILNSNEESCLTITTGITPNADGRNDLWVIDGMEYYPEATMIIYNRWGEVIYETKNYYNNPWDGKYKGVIVPVDSYHYIIRFTSGSPDITGVITVIK
ncbi:hypothetical protein LCGC14_2498260, partial [marine sediment metagenome]